MESLLGRSGDPIECKKLGGAAVHWFDSDAAVGAPCLCGETRRAPYADEQPADHAAPPAGPAGRED